MIRLEKFCLSYKGSAAPTLDGINLHVRKGESILVTGPTGCGKTTLFRVMAGLIKAENGVSLAGEIRINGHSTTEVNASRDGTRVGILFQNPDDQLTGWTPREEVAFGLENLGLDNDEISRRTTVVLREADLLDKADHPVKNLSGGQKQRLAVAAVMALNPDVLLLDEPISNLDWRGRKRLVDFLKKMKSQGSTILVCSHEFDEFLGFCDRRIDMKEGRLLTPGASCDEDEYETRASELPAEVPNSGFPQDEKDVHIISLQDVSVVRKESGFTLGPVEISIYPGERVAVFGLNGCGKTTLLNLMAGMIKPSGGEISMKGRKVRKLDRHLRDIAYVSQNPDLMLHCSTVERELTSRTRYLKLKLPDAAHGLETDLDTFSLKHLRGRHPFSLSQGQRQRLALASSLTGGAGLFLIDEPTTGQDWSQTGEILGQLTRLAGEGMAIVFSTHNFRAAGSFASRALVMKEGTIVYDGSMTDLINNPVPLHEAGYEGDFRFGAKKPGGGV